MSLLAPLFLTGLLAIAVPIIVHLVHRERKDPLAFPSLMFLRRVPFRSARRQRIRYWLLFLLRVMALVLIAGAFARPWLKSPPAIVRAAAGGKDIVVMIDNSYSMTARGVWERARGAASAAIDNAGSNDRIAVIAFGEQATLLARLEESRARAQAAINTARPGSEVTRFGPAFKLAASVLAGSADGAEIVVITDRQRNGWRNVEQVAVPRKTTLRVADVHANVADIAITDVHLSQSIFAGRQRFVPSARILNRGDGEARVPVELHLGGRAQQARTVTVAPRGATVVNFDPVFANAAAGRVRIESGDDIAIDDVAYFTTSSNDAPVVRVVSSSRDAAFYLENALSAAGDNAFTLLPTVPRLGAADLQGADVVVFLAAALPAGAAAERLRDFVREGGGVIVTADAAARTDNDLLPVSRIAMGDHSDRPTTVVSIDAAHPVFAPFRASGTDQFAALRITRYARSEPRPAAAVLARFHDGAPAVVDQRIGRGRAVYWGSSFARSAGDLVLQPVFVPFVHQLVRHAAQGARVPRSFVVGNVMDVNALAPADADAVILTPAGQRVRVPPASGARTVRITEPGIYQVRGVGPNAATHEVAANLDVSESDLALIEPAVFNDAISPSATPAEPRAARQEPGDREQQQALWWYLLLIAFALLAAETLYANRISSAWRS